MRNTNLSKRLPSMLEKEQRATLDRQAQSARQDPKVRQAG